MKPINMAMRRTIERSLVNAFGRAFESLPLRNRLALIRDLHDLDCAEGIRDFDQSAAILSKRIGGWFNLRSYTDCLIVN